MVEVKIIGTNEEYHIDDANSIYHDEKTGLSLIPYNGKLISAPTSRLLVIADIKNKESSND